MVSVLSAIAGILFGFSAAQLSDEATRSAESTVQPGQWNSTEPCRSDLCVSFDNDEPRVFSSVCSGHLCTKFEAQLSDDDKAGIRKAFGVVRSAGIAIEQLPGFTAHNEREQGGYTQ